MHHSLQGLGRAGRQACAMALHQAQGQRGKYLTLELARTRNPVENLCASVSKFQSAKIGVELPESLKDMFPWVGGSAGPSGGKNSRSCGMRILLTGHKG